jgi:DNA-binding MarR family transcriptional regulator
MTSVNGYPDHIFSALDRALRALREDLTAEVTQPEVRARLSGLRSSQLRLLGLIPADGMRVTDLAARVGMTKQALGEFASALEARGLLESVGDPADRRVRRLRPTVTGLEVAALSDRAIRTMEARWRDRIGAERWDVMKQTLHEIQESSSAAPDPAEPDSDGGDERPRS